MTSAMEILETINSAVGQLWLVDGERLRYRLPENLAPLVEVIRERKPEIVELLAQRPPMPAGVRLIRWEPKAAPVRLSQCETVVDTEKFIRSTLRQLEACLNGNDWLAGNRGSVRAIGSAGRCWLPGCPGEPPEGVAMNAKAKPSSPNFGLPDGKELWTNERT